MAQRDIGCEACGALLPMQISRLKLHKPNVWYPGKPCPMCGSEKFFPVVAITETDRRQEQPASIKRRLLINPWTGIVALGVSIVVVLGVIVWPKQRRDRGEKVLFSCQACSEVFLARKGSTPPVKCRECGERDAHRAAACVRCSRVYSYGRTKCPHCAYTLRRTLNSADEAAKATKAHAEYLKLEREQNNELEQ